MKQIVLLTSLICSLSTYREAVAQGFWYVPPGADYSYRYGIDLGNGFGYGYGFGFGYGSDVSPYAAAGGAAADLATYQGSYGATAPSRMNYSVWSGAQTVNATQPPSPESLAQQRELKLARAKMEKSARARQRAREEAVDRLHLPRLEDHQLDRATGRIAWPDALQRVEFSDKRVELESLLSSLAQAGATTELSAELTSKTQQLRQELRQQVRTIPSTEYLEGHTFLNRLAREAL